MERVYYGTGLMTQFPEWFATPLTIAPQRTLFTQSPEQTLNPAGYLVPQYRQQTGTRAPQYRSLDHPNYQQHQVRWLPNVDSQNNPPHAFSRAGYTMNFASLQQTNTGTPQHRNLAPENYSQHLMQWLPTVAPQNDPQHEFGRTEHTVNFASLQRANTSASGRQNLAPQSYSQHQVPRLPNITPQNNPQHTFGHTKSKINSTIFASLPPDQQEMIKRHFYQQISLRRLNLQRQAAGSQMAAPTYAHPTAVPNLGYLSQHVVTTGQNPNQIPSQASIKTPLQVAITAIPSERLLETSNTQSQGTVSPVAITSIPSQRLLETPNNQSQGTVPPVAKSLKRPLDTSDTQSQEAAGSSPPSAKKRHARKKSIVEIVDEPLPTPPKAPMTEEQKAVRKKIYRGPPAWMHNPQLRTINGETVHVEELDREKKLRIEALDVIDNEGLVWLEKYEERQRKIDVLREEMEFDSLDGEIADRQVWDRFYNPPLKTILDPVLEATFRAQDAVAPAPKSTNRPLKLGSKKAKMLAKKQALQEERAKKMEAKEKEKAAKKQKANEEKAAATALKIQEAAKKAAQREADKEAKRQAKTAKATKTAKKPTTKTTTKPNPSRKISSSSIDSEAFTASPAESASTPATSPEGFNAQDTDDNADAPGEYEEDWRELELMLEAPEDGMPAAENNEVDDLFEGEDTSDDEEEEDDLARNIKLAFEEGPAEDAHVDGEDRYDEDGFDELGFDREGYKRNGYNKSGLDRNGYDAVGNKWDEGDSEAE